MIEMGRKGTYVCKLLEEQDVAEYRRGFLTLWEDAIEETKEDSRDFLKQRKNENMDQWEISFANPMKRFFLLYEEEVETPDKIIGGVEIDFSYIDGTQAEITNAYLLRSHRGLLSYRMLQQAPLKYLVEETQLAQVSATTNNSSIVHILQRNGYRVEKMPSGEDDYFYLVQDLDVLRPKPPSPLEPGF
jgi:hypothetical protein